MQYLVEVEALSISRLHLRSKMEGEVRYVLDGKTGLSLIVGFGCSDCLRL